jgi:hypothetical protein
MYYILDTKSKNWLEEEARNIINKYKNLYNQDKGRRQKWDNEIKNQENELWDLLMSHKLIITPKDLTKNYKEYDEFEATQGEKNNIIVRVK